MVSQWFTVVSQWFTVVSQFLQSFSQYPQRPGSFLCVRVCMLVYTYTYRLCMMPTAGSATHCAYHTCIIAYSVYSVRSVYTVYCILYMFLRVYIRVYAYVCMCVYMYIACVQYTA